MDLLELQNLPWGEVRDLVKSIRSGDLFSALRPASALFSWLTGKLSRPVDPPVTATMPASDLEMAAELESAADACESAVRGEPAAVGMAPLLASVLLPWLLNLLGRALAGQKPN